MVSWYRGGKLVRRRETYIRVQGRWCYLYRAIDRDGQLIDTRFSDTRDLAAAEAFFRSAWTVTGVRLDRITTDGHDADPHAIRNVCGDQVTAPDQPLS
jgi:putative transposase